MRYKDEINRNVDSEGINENNLDEIVPLSIRAKKKVVENFREQSNLESISQGDLLEKLFEFYFQNRVVKNKLLIKPLDGKPKTITFDGKIILGFSRNEIIDAHMEQVKKLAIEKDIEYVYKAGNSVRFDICIYYTKGKKYLIYEAFQILIDGKLSLLNYTTYDIADTLDQLTDKVEFKLYTHELNNLLFLTVEEEFLDI